MPARISLEVPSRALLGAYEAALQAGWSPNTMRDVSPEQLALIARDSDAFIAGLIGRGGRISLDDGREVDKLPDRVRWIFAGDRPERPFVGAINLRWLEDAEGRPMQELPAHVFGHVGYSILPAFAGNGYASAALAAITGEAREIGLPRIVITCDEDNRASRRVIEKNGGRLVETFTAPPCNPDARLRFIIDIAP